VFWFGEYTLGLDLDQAFAHLPPPPKQRHLFHVYSSDLQKKSIPFSLLKGLVLRMKAALYGVVFQPCQDQLLSTRI
jgi:hypothetical protein